MTTLYGMPVITSPDATERRVVVEKLPIRKRRKRYRVVVKQVPAIYQMRRRFVMHPELYAKLLAACGSTVV